ncbi:MAG TPA: PPC domain-containing protein [Longimicrobium sp.]|nr:PPC domain-containing protein [Longimicrobium sp.]
MYRALHVLGLLLLATAPAAAQNTIRPGQSVTGQLTASDPTLDDGSHYDVWRFAGVANHRYRITLRSADFDAYLSVGTATVSACDDCTSNDDGAGGTDAQVDFVGSADGTYEIRAKSYEADQTGGYELTLEDHGEVEPQEHEHAEAPMGTPIALGQAVTGELARGDRKEESSYVDTWTYMGRAGETLVITLRSEDFDAFLKAGEYEAGECRELEHNDNGGGGRDARMTVELPGDGAYHIHVSSVDQGDTGTYTLLVERAAERPASPPMPIAPGETLDGRLTESDGREGDGSYFDAWTFRGRAGETFVITLSSQDFDAFLRFGRMAGDEFESMETDDDGAHEGTDSRLTVTLAHDGEYVIRAGTYDADETGAYTLRLERP